jgi:WD40 repeat protein/uncharacterized caspase-like protein
MNCGTVWTGPKPCALKRMRLIIKALTGLCLMLAGGQTPAHPAAQSFQKPVLHRQAMHTRAAATVVFSNAEKNLFASGSEDSTIKLYEATNGREIRTLRGHEKQVYQVAFSPDGELLASASEDGTVRVWKVRTGEPIHILSGHGGPVTSVAFSVSGVLASGGWDGNARLWNVVTGKEIRALRGRNGYVTAVAFSGTDGNLLATGGMDNQIRLWNVRTGLLLHTLQGHEGVINALSFSLRGDLLASGSGDYTVRLWEVQSKSLRAVLAGHSYAVNSVSFAPDGDTLASCSDDAAIKFWSVVSGRAVRSFNGHKFKAYSVDFSPDGARLISSGADEAIRIWNVAGGTVSRELRLQSYPEKQVAVSRDGTKVATATLEEISLQTIGEGREALALRGHAGFITALAFSEDGEWLASSSEDGTVKLWDVRAGLERASLAGGPQVRRLALSPDGRRLVTQDEDAAVKLWSLETRKEILRLASHPAPVTSLALSRNGETVACGYWNGDIKLWTIADGRESLRIEAVKFSSPVAALAFNHDDQMLASGEWVTPNVKLWDVGTGRLLHQFRWHQPGGKSIGFSHDDDVQKVSFNDDGTLLVSGGRDSTVRVWDVAGKRPLAIFRGHSSTVKEARFIANGRDVLSGGVDGEFIIWRTQDAEELARLMPIDGENWLAVTPDGLFDGSPDAWRQLLWRFNNDTFDFVPVESFYNEFYHPGLFREILDGARPVAPRDFASLDRRQPTIKVSLTTDAAEPQSPAGETSKRPLKARTANVIVEVTEAAANEPKRLPVGDVRDVRLFRNGSLVKIWRGRTVTELHDQAGCELVPSTKGGGRKLVCRTMLELTAGLNQLTAYAFNRDNVKSNDAQTTVQGDDSLKRDGTLYVFAIGVNRYADASHNLRFAVADIKDISAALARQQVAVRQYAQTKIVELTDYDATKANVIFALRLFAGAPRPQPDNLSPTALQELSKIEPAKPEDALLIYFSGHGTAKCESGADGKSQCDRFYLIPHNGFPAQTMEVEKQRAFLYQNSISDEDLEFVLERIGAGKLLMVIDACKSGQALEAEEKRRGPMNSKGLAQLAYEKGMHIMAAAQSYQAALESARLGHGYLTYVLVEEGLKTRAADTSPKDGQVTVREWLNYSGERVPQIQEESEASREVILDTSRRQRPRVFFRREAEAHPFIIVRFGVK